MKFIMVFTAVILLALVPLASCYKINDPEDYKMQNVFAGEQVDASVTYEQKIAEATHIVRATCTGETNKGPLIDGFLETEYLRFRVTDTLKGSVDGGYIDLRCPVDGNVIIEDGATYSNYFRVGEDYILVLDKHVSVYFDQDWYSLVSPNYYTPRHVTTRGSAYDDFSVKYVESELYDQMWENYAKILSENPPAAEFSGEDYIRSSDLNVIFDQSPCVFKVQIGESVQSGIGLTSNGFACSVIECLKGEPDGNLLKKVRFIPDTVEEGKTYIVFLKQSGIFEDSYVITSKTSVVSVDDEAAVNEIYRLAQNRS